MALEGVEELRDGEVMRIEQSLSEKKCNYILEALRWRCGILESGVQRRV